MRSHSSSRSRSHSSMSRRSSMHSRSRSSMHSSRMHHSSLGSRHHSSLASRSRSSLASRKSSFKKHGISNAHAFAVGKATGVNINGSALGAHGAMLHHSKSAIRRHRNTSVNRARTIKSIRRSSFNNSSNNLARRKYTLNKNKYGNVNDFGKATLGSGVFIWIMSLFFFIPIMLFIIMTFFFMIRFII